MKKVLNIIGICLGVICIGYGITGSYNFFEGLGFILFGLPLISWFRNQLMKFIQVKKKRVLAYIAIIITSLIFLGIGTKSISNYSNDKLDTTVLVDKNNEENSIEEDKNKQLTVNEILSNPKKYEGEYIAVQGSLLTGGNVIVNGDIGNIRPALYGENNEYLVLLGEWPTQENVKNVIVYGKISIDEKETCLTVEKYDYSNAVSIESTQDLIDLHSTLSSLKEASKGYVNMNWNQFIMNPTSLAGTYVYIPGEVVDMDIVNGQTTGLISTNKNSNELVSFVIKGEVYDFTIGSYIAPTGFISQETGSAYNNATGETITTPLIVVENASLWRTEYEVDLSDKEIQEFLYGTYEAIDTNDFDKNLGVSFVFDSKTIGGYPYKFKEMSQLNPVLKVGTRDYGSATSARIGMNLISDEIGVAPTSESQKVTTVSIDLYGNDVLVNSDGHSHHYHKN